MQNIKKILFEIDCENYSGSEGKPSGQLSQCYFHFNFGIASIGNVTV